MGDFGCFIWPTSPDVFLDAFKGVEPLRDAYL